MLKEIIQEHMSYILICREGVPLPKERMAHKIRTASNLMARVFLATLGSDLKDIDPGVRGWELSTCLRDVFANYRCDDTLDIQIWAVHLLCARMAYAGMEGLNLTEQLKYCLDYDYGELGREIINGLRKDKDDMEATLSRYFTLGIQGLLARLEPYLKKVDSEIIPESIKVLMDKYLSDDDLSIAGTEVRESIDISDLTAGYMGPTTTTVSGTDSLAGDSTGDYDSAFSNLTNRYTYITQNMIAASMGIDIESLNSVPGYRKKKEKEKDEEEYKREDTSRQKSEWMEHRKSRLDDPYIRNERKYSYLKNLELALSRSHRQSCAFYDTPTGYTSDAVTLVQLSSDPAIQDITFEVVWDDSLIDLSDKAMALAFERYGYMNNNGDGDGES